jgi:hypothetical protein
MNADLRRVGLDEYAFGAINPRGGVVSGPSSVANVRFRSENVEVFDPKRLFPASHVVNRINRYKALNWDGSIPEPLEEIASLSPPQPEDNDPKRSEELRTRSAISGTIYSPEHLKLQNAMYDWLVGAYGKRNVLYEKNFVDLTLRVGKATTFFEIKTAPTAKACIREAFGQLLEYGHYFKKNAANRLVVVGSRIATPEDRAYLKHLRQLYRIPLWYRRWSWDTGELEAEL